MKMKVSELKQQIIGPTLKYLGVESDVAEELLLGTAALESKLDPLCHHDDGIGIYQITPRQHRQIWDQYLAFRPDLASKVRGLASQHRFLEDPDQELGWNLSYATAIAWLIYQREAVALPMAGDTRGLSRLWLKCFQHDGDHQRNERRFSGWLNNYRRSAAVA